MSQSSPQTGYFINISQNDYGDSTSTATGYWEPHTSSIDFCESNYLLSNLVVEPHNVWSSLFGLSLFGIVGILYGNPTREWRTTVVYTILLVIGLGSACLHASLHWCFQSSDELPMIYLIIGFLYSVLEVDSPKDSPKYPHLAKYLILLSCINTAIYYTFQHLYIVFLVTFNAMTVMLLSTHVQIARRLYHESRDEKRKTNNSAIALRFYIWHIIILVFVATPIWALDQFHCDILLPIYNNLPFLLRGMTLHVVWHIGAGMATHCFVQFLCACRASTLGMVCDTRCLLGVLPVVIALPKIGANVKQA
mmetsp:Transcript_29582/g.62745  ORF Transcript_29582/g.62745 Transcript_29582/m.62745 type:complete len:307 (-) Transcript_29582:137-1057(-)